MDSENFHRLTKALVDSGEARTLDEAERLFEAYGVRIVLAPEAAVDVTAQMIVLTAINAAARSFKGNVGVEWPAGAPLVTRGFAGQSIEDFLRWLGVEAVRPRSESWPTIYVGPPGHCKAGHIRPWADGWSFGLGNETSGEAIPAACVAAGGLAVSDAFSLLRKDSPYQGRPVRCSLWDVGSTIDGPAPLRALEIPSMSLVGLGHLGQAYAWTLGFSQPADGARFVLQDVDLVSRSTISTSLLSGVGDVSRPKTTVVSAWLQARGFETETVDRRFDEAQRVGPGDPQVALFGVDNAAARRAIEGAGWRFVVDAGLGAGYRDFRAVRIRTFPGPSKAADLWASDSVLGQSDAPAYADLIANGAEPCGVTTLATRAVGAPFVGCVAAAYAVAEMQRHQLAAASSGYIDFTLRDLSKLEVDRASDWSEELRVRQLADLFSIS